jgi:hypothetical protein
MTRFEKVVLDLMLLQFVLQVLSLFCRKFRIQWGKRVRPFAIALE